MPEIMNLMSTPANVFDRWAPFEVDILREQAVVLHKTISEMSENFSVELSARDSAFYKAEEYASSLLDRAQRAEEYASSLAKELAKERNQDSPS